MTAKASTNRFRPAGFSILSVVVAAGLSVMVAMGVASLLSSSSKGVTDASARLEFQFLVGNIRAVLEQPSSCAIALKDESSSAVAKFQPGGSLSPASLLKEISIGTTSVVKSGNKLGQLKEVKLSLTEVDPTLRQTVGSDVTYFAKLDISGVRYSGKGVLTHALLMRVTTNTAGGTDQHRITQCSLGGPSGSSLSGKFLCACPSYNSLAGSLANISGCNPVGSGGVAGAGIAVTICDSDKGSQVCWPFGGHPTWACSPLS